MKQTVLLLTLVMALSSAAQQVPAQQASDESAPGVQRFRVVRTGASMVARQEAPTYSDMYCSGFITNQSIGKIGYVAGGWDTPHQTRFVDREYVYLSGRGFSEGQQYWIVREVRDPNRYEAFKGLHAMTRGLGKPYADIARVRVIGLRNNIAISQVEFGCTDIMPGDAAIPFTERATPSLRPKINFDRFAPPNGKLTGKIIMTKDFDVLAGMGQKVYLNLGANQGVKIGDYFRAVRTYDTYRYDDVDNLSFKPPFYDDMQVPAGVFPYSRLHEFPRMSLGEMIVLNVTPTSSTAMITLSLEDIHLGDAVEVEEAPAAAAVAHERSVRTKSAAVPAEAAVSPAAAPQAPMVACSANPATVRAGESSTVTCEASSPDHRPLSFSFSSPHARLVAHDNSAVLDTSDLAAGPVEVLATVSDDRDLKASSRTTVDIEQPRPQLTPAKLNVVSFKRNSAYVNNVAKAVLDDVALRMQRDSGSSVVVLGLVESGEPQALAKRRAGNAADYLSKSKGIDAKRLQLRDGGEYGNKAELWLVPPGMQLQEADLKH